MLRPSQKKYIMAPSFYQCINRSSCSALQVIRPEPYINSRPHRPKTEPIVSPSRHGLGPKAIPSASLRFSSLRAGLLLLLLPQSHETDTRDLDDLEADTGNITLGLALATETGKENLVVLVNEVQATVVGDESSDLLAVLNKLDLDTLADSGVGLLGLNTDLLKDDTLGVGGTTEGGGLVGGSEEALLEVQVGPASFTALVAQLAGGVQSTRLSLTHIGGIVFGGRSRLG